MAEDIIKITNHADAAVARLNGRYKGKPRVEAMVRALANRVQELEDVATDFVEARQIQNATGTMLDIIGSLVGADRQGYDDDFYRVLIYVKIAENYTSGQPGPLMLAYRLLANATSVQYTNLGNGHITLLSDGYTPVIDTDFIYAQLERLLAAGVKIDSITFIEGGDGFAFEGGNGLGFADPSGQNGGKLAVYIPNPEP